MVSETEREIHPYKSISSLLTVIDVIERRVGIVGVVDDQRTAQAVTVLGGQVAVVPESA